MCTSDLSSSNYLTLGWIRQDRAFVGTVPLPLTLNSVKNPYAVELGRLGGLKGGKARADRLTPERRGEIAKIAASARWRKKG